MIQKNEVLIVGGGIAGMAYAVRLRTIDQDNKFRIRILTKAPVDQSNSFAAQGGVAAVTSSQDSIEQHVKDTLMVGGGRCIPSVVRRVVSEGSACINELIAMGARFDADANGLLQLTNEGGHSHPRVVHHLDRTGAEIVRVLLTKVLSLGIEIIPWQRALDLIVEDRNGERRCVGVRSLDLGDGTITDRYASHVILATGGAGQVYKHTTNPTAATGDGIAMALRAAVPVRDMGFVQFHPTALFTRSEGTVHLISEAVRGAGAILRDRNGIAFMKDLHPMADLAPRNVVAREIHRKIKEQGSEHVWLDASPIGVGRFKEKFPAIAAVCEEHGIVPGRDPIPVMPAAHYLCGGIRTDDLGRTTLNRLIALGECASTGLHGADRLASNSLLEALVISRRAADRTLIDQAIDNVGTASNETRIDMTKDDPKSLEMLSRLRSLMTTDFGILRAPEGMKAALAGIRKIVDLAEQRWKIEDSSLALIDTRDLAMVAWSIADQAKRERVSVGTHYISTRLAA